MRERSFRWQIEKGDFNRGGEVSSGLKDILRKLGISSQIVRRAVIVTFELEMNIIIHSEGGEIEGRVNREGITLCARDRGPGISDLEKAFQPGYSTAGAEIRRLGFGAGMGLTNIQRYSDDLAVETGEGEATVIKAAIGFCRPD